MADLSFTDGEYIFREGESAEFAYIVKSGEVQITKITATGEDSLAVIKNPTLFGEMALIDGSPRSAGARAGDRTGDSIPSCPRNTARTKRSCARMTARGKRW